MLWFDQRPSGLGHNCALLVRLQGYGPELHVDRRTQGLLHGKAEGPGWLFTFRWEDSIIGQKEKTGSFGLCVCGTVSLLAGHPSVALISMYCFGVYGAPSSLVCSGGSNLCHVILFLP